MKRLPPHGFTLIELLVSISIIALLSSFVFASLRNARDSAREKTALQFAAQNDRIMGADAAGIWNFEEGSGTTATDVSGWGNNGTIYGATYSTDTYNDSLSKHALLFNGGVDRVEMGNPVSGDARNPNSVTVSAWVKSNNISANQQIVCRNGPYFLRIAGSKLRLMLFTGTWTYLGGSKTLSSNVWYHLLMTYDGSSLKGYVNGEVDASKNVTGQMRSFGALFIGYGTSGGSNTPFYGAIDDVRIFTRSLTAQEIKSQYLAGVEKLYASGLIDAEEYRSRLAMEE